MHTSIHTVRCDRIVPVKDTRSQTSSVWRYKHSCVVPFRVQNVQKAFWCVFKSQIYGNTPDVVNDSSRQVFVLEVSRTFDHSLTEKYQPLANIFTTASADCLCVSKSVSTGNVHKLVERGRWQQCSMKKKKLLARWYSVSAITGSHLFAALSVDVYHEGTRAQAEVVLFLIYDLFSIQP